MSMVGRSLLPVNLGELFKVGQIFRPRGSTFHPA
jgi:hypothetical protein